LSAHTIEKGDCPLFHQVFIGQHPAALLEPVVDELTARAERDNRAFDPQRRVVTAY
jgi:hypothetical protein